MVFSPNDVWVAASAIARFWEIQKHAQNYAYAKWQLSSKKTFKLLGIVVLNNDFEKCILNGQETVELGFRLFKHERQKDYIKEATTSLCEDIQARAFKSVLAFSKFNNIPAHHLLIKLGFIQPILCTFSKYWRHFIEKYCKKNKLKT